MRAEGARNSLDTRFPYEALQRTPDVRYTQEPSPDCILLFPAWTNPGAGAPDMPSTFCIQHSGLSELSSRITQLQCFFSHPDVTIFFIVSYFQFF